jgi:hypothetical protein
MRRTLISLIAIAVTMPLVTVFAAKNSPVSKTFKVGADCKIFLADDKAGAFADMKVGDKIRIAYSDDGSNSVAHRIQMIAEGKGGGKGDKAHGSGKKTSGDTQARGTISALDKTAGTVTVDVHQKTAK